MATEIMVSIGSAYGLLPDGIKPFQKWCSITKICLKMTYLISFRGQRVNKTCRRHYAKYVIISNQTYQADITMSSKISIQWTSRRRKSPATWLLVQQLVQANNKGTTKAPHYWSFFRVNHRCIPLTKAQQHRTCFHAMTSPCYFLTSHGGSSCHIWSAEIFPSWCSTSLAALSPEFTAPSM